jgi:hypothetical protein
MKTTFQNERTQVSGIAENKQIPFSFNGEAV